METHLIIELIKDISEKCLAPGRTPIFNEPIFPNSVYYHFMYYLTKELKFPVAVELGVNGGGASFHLCKGNPDGKVIGVEYSNDMPGNIEFIKKECPNFVFIFDDAYRVSTEIWDKYGTIDFLFLDTVHTYDDTMRLFNLYYPCLSENSIVCLDDLLRPGMQKAYEDLPGIKIRDDCLHLGGGPQDGGFATLILGDE